MHRLVLPLPSGYAVHDREGFSCCATASPCTSPSIDYERLDAYLDDLCAFLRETRLIQRHPESYFDFVRGEEWRQSTLHLDGSLITEDELTSTMELCGGFQAHFTDDSLTQLRDLIRDGPPLPATAPSTVEARVHRFFRRTKELQLGRTRRTSNDSASFTLNHCCAATSTTSQPPTNSAEEAAAERILNIVLSRGMNEKKQHEVRIMRATVADLVRCTSEGRHRHPEVTGSDADVRTVLNVGEGKGYVSRALALCDGLQVVGIDCNPAHKERGAECISQLLEYSLRMRGGDESRCGENMDNLLYVQRGHTASVAARVEEHMDWAALLHGHVRTAQDADPHGRVAEVELSRRSDEDRDLAQGWNLLLDPKLKCRACGKLIRQSSKGVLRHANSHWATNGGDQRFADGSAMPSKNEVEQWNLKYSQHQYVQTIIANFFIPAASRQGEETTSSAEAPSLERIGLITRGLRLRVRRMVSSSTNGDEDVVELEDVPRIFTIVGYDDGCDLHRVVVDDLPGRHSYAIYLAPDGGEELAWNPVWAADLGQERHRALLVEVLPPPSPTLPIVRVPSLHNTVMIGLHTCGDLGSNICRLFANSQSAGLLLVSCCWHALTSSGFPFSHAIRRRGMDINTISLLLATQPLDMWSTASPEGHRSSAKILFFRSLFKLFWSTLQKRWEAEPVTLTHPSACSHACPFAPLPNLEPAVLRRLSREKDEITFPAFVEKLCAEYIFTPTAKQTQYTWHRVVCSVCRSNQERFIRECVEVKEIPAQLMNQYCGPHFASFLGLTVLRMWMCHLVESLLLLDRVLFLHETFIASASSDFYKSSVVSLVPLFDGAISPRMYGILARRE